LAFAETWKFDNRWQLFVEELVGGRTLRVYRLRGVEVVADHRTGDHLGGVRGVLANHEYRALLDQIPVRTIRTVVDVGAHVGGFVLLLRMLGAPLARVLCVEPNPMSRMKLDFNLQHNGISADVLAAAVSDDCGKAVLHYGLYSTGSSLLADQPNRGLGTIEVVTTTLDVIFERYFANTDIDICKMDVEGAEFQILLGDHANMLTKCKYLLCEIHKVASHSRQDLIHAMKMRGFVLVLPIRKAPNDAVLFRNQTPDAI